MASTAEIIFRITADAKQAKAELAQVRTELTRTAQVQKTTNQSELSMKQQLSAAASLQRQRSAALIGQWKQQETAALRLASGIRPVGDNLQRITDVMQTLGGASASLQGPLGGVAGRLRSLGALATEAGGGLGIVGVAAGALVVGLTAAAVAIYKITVAAADFQGRMYDLSQQTGVSVETLSTLEAVARTTGGNIESITASLGIFQKNLENAQDPTSKEAQLLKELGVETLNTEDALRQTLARLAAMPEGFTQTSHALELFGRGGKQLLAILKETHGDLDATTERLRAMGILITTDAAAAADKFNDRLAEVGLQIRGLTAIIGNEAMPAIEEAIKDVSKFLTENRGVIAGWAGDIADAARGVVVFVGVLKEMNDVVSGLKALPPGFVQGLLEFASAFPGIHSLPQALQRLGNQGIPEVKVPDLAVPIRQGGPSGSVIKKSKGGGADSARKAAQAALDAQIKGIDLAEKREQQGIQESIDENKRSFSDQIRDIEEFTRRAIELADQRLNAIIDRTNKEAEALAMGLRKKLITQKEFDERWIELGIEVEDARQENSNESFQLEQERDRKISQAEIVARQRQLRISEEADVRQISRIRSRIDEGILLESEGAKQIAEIVDEMFERRKKALEAEGVAYATSLERRKAITDELVSLEGDRAFAAEEAARRIVKARFQEENGDFSGATRPRKAIDPLIEAGPFKTLATELSTIGNLSRETSQIIGETLAGAFQNLSSAVGQAVQSFVLFGKVEGGFRKFAADLIASLAASAAVQALYQLAQGLAWLALNFFFPNPKYILAANTAFASAAVFGSIAGVATLAGRAVSGNNFNGAGAGSSGSNGSSGETTKPREPKDVVADRRQGLQSPAINVNVTVKRDAGSIVEVFVDDYRQNGKLRDLILSDGQA